jgi:hypothetical protein
VLTAAQAQVVVLREAQSPVRLDDRAMLLVAEDGDLVEARDPGDFAACD